MYSIGANEHPADISSEEVAQMITKYDLFLPQEQTQLLLGMLATERDYWCRVVPHVLEYNNTLAKDQELLSLHFRKWLSTGAALWDVLLELQSMNFLCILINSNNSI